MKEVHICPILMRTVIRSDASCQEKCGEDRAFLKLLLTLTLQ